MAGRKGKTARIRGHGAKTLVVTAATMRAKAQKQGNGRTQEYFIPQIGGASVGASIHRPPKGVAVPSSCYNRVRVTYRRGALFGDPNEDQTIVRSKQI